MVDPREHAQQIAGRLASQLGAQEDPNRLVVLDLLGKGAYGEVGAACVCSRVVRVLWAR